MKRHVVIVLLLIIVLFGFYLRVSELTTMPFWIDETISATAVLGILEHGYPLLESGATYWRAWIFSYLTVPFVALFGIEIGMRLVSVLFGIATILLAYIYGKRFISPTAGLGFALLVSISFLEIIYSKQARFYQMFQFFYFLSFYLFYVCLIKKEKILSHRWMDYGLLVLSIYITINTQFMGFILIPLFCGIYGIYHFHLIKKYKILLFVLSGIAIWFGIHILSRLSLSSFSWDIMKFSWQFYNTYIFGATLFLVFFIAGLVYGLYHDWKLTVSFGSVILVPVIGLFFVETFGTRYVYFALFGVFFYIVYFFWQLRWPVLVLGLFILMNPFAFTFSPVGLVNYDASMPFADWKSAYASIDSDMPIVATWPQGAVMYGNIDYWIWYSVGGRSNETWMLHQGRERFSNATIIRSVSELPPSFILVLDEQASRKISRSYISFISSHCTVTFTGLRITVFECVV